MKVFISRTVSASTTATVSRLLTPYNMLSPWCSGRRVGAPITLLHRRLQAVLWIVQDGRRRSVVIQTPVYMGIFRCLPLFLVPKDLQQLLLRAPIRLVFH